MLDLKKLQKKRVQLIETDARAITNLAEIEERKLTNEERGKFDALMDEADDIQDQIDVAVRQRDAERSIANQVQEIEDTLSNTDKGSPEAQRAAAQLTQFRGFLVSGQVRDMGEELRSLQADNDIQAGYLVPPEQFVRQLIKAVDDQTFVRQLATKFTLNESASMGAVSMDNDPSDADWTAEVGTVQRDSTMSVGKRSLTPHKLAKEIIISKKLLRLSAIPAEQLIIERLAYKFGITEEKGFLTGNGNQQPLGVFTASSDGISTGRDFSTGNTTTEIRLDGLIEAKYGLKAQYQQVAQWLFNRTGVKQIAKLKDGNGQYIWEPSKKVGDPDMLLGNPVHQSEYAPATFTTGLYVGILGDWSKYWIADSLAFEIQRLNELYAKTGQVGFIGEAELDGMPVLEEAFARVTLG